MNEQESILDMGRRPSRQRRHLPTSITAAANTRSDKGRRNIPLLNMFNEKQEDRKDCKSTGYESTATTIKKRKKSYQQQQQTHKQKARQFVTKSNTGSATDAPTKIILYVLGSLWILFVIYRVYFSMQIDDFSYLSIVRFISKKVTDLMHEPTL